MELLQISAIVILFCLGFGILVLQSEFYTWIRDTFGFCKGRWFHDWNDEGDKRNCKICGAKDILLGWDAPMDMDPIRIWKRVQ